MDNNLLLMYLMLDDENTNDTGRYMEVQVASWNRDKNVLFPPYIRTEEADMHLIIGKMDSKTESILPENCYSSYAYDMNTKLVCFDNRNDNFLNFLMFITENQIRLKVTNLDREF